MNTKNRDIESLLRQMFGLLKEDEPPTHKHRCETCGFIWEHETNCINNTKAHTCIKCGAEQWHWYEEKTGTVPFLSCAKA